MTQLEVFEGLAVTVVGAIFAGLVEYFRILNTSLAWKRNHPRAKGESSQDYEDQMVIQRIERPKPFNSIFRNSVVPLFLFSLFNFKNYPTIWNTILIVCIVTLVLLNELIDGTYRNLSDDWRYKLLIAGSWVLYGIYLLKSSYTHPL
jgi:hypothetical protein